ncbi:MAG: DMT family transporter [Patescibacteria group bacterium]
MIGYLQVLGAVLIWAIFNGAVVRGCKTSGVGVGTWTGLTGVVIFSLFFLLGGHSFPHLNQAQVIGLVCLGTFAALNNICCYTGIKISMVNTLLFHYLAPLLIPVWAILIPSFKINIGVMDIVALVVGVVGMIWIGIPNFQGNKKWLYFALGSAFFYSLEIVFSGYVSSKDHLYISDDIAALAKLSTQAIFMPFVGTILLARLLPKIDFSLGIKNNEISKLMLGGALLYVSFILYFSGSATVGAMPRGMLGYIDRIGAIVIGVIFFHEKITKQAWIGGAIILGASLLVVLFR